MSSFVQVTRQISIRKRDATIVWIESRCEDCDKKPTIGRKFRYVHRLSIHTDRCTNTKCDRDLCSHCQKKHQCRKRYYPKFVSESKLPLFVEEIQRRIQKDKDDFLFSSLLPGDRIDFLRAGIHWTEGRIVGFNDRLLTVRYERDFDLGGSGDMSMTAMIDLTRKWDHLAPAQSHSLCHGKLRFALGLQSVRRDLIRNLSDLPAEESLLQMVFFL